MVFILRTSKTHWHDAKPQSIKINGIEYDALGNCFDCSLPLQRMGSGRRGGDDLCPFEALQQFLAVRTDKRGRDEPFFIFSDTSPVQANHFRAILKSLLEMQGLEASLYSSHSLRIGCCGDLLDLGLDVSTICKLGRWQSNVVYTYLKQ